ncbi:hypothetical protein C7H19_13445 [Aphanothece hegewaldii CCALA 016]|uniref:Uncharacterized protein n=1 Tax=Aphanothece hegewaldii CCALA 016 TaxID=2107694 RepID=A0A2T1LX75_9CHRO|nr:hypothetical protein [Aphanothece hegewaldii]PSF36674.1 hypothetical protein C7H19_13445 [Aphanothece hegewaldii CCALA 016]
MTNVTRSSALEHEQNLWENLKQAIAASSGFKRWQEEQEVIGTLPCKDSACDDRPVAVNEQIKEDNLDERVNSYLRETLEALAY